MIHISRILCPIDFSKCSKIAFKNAIELAKKTNAQLHLFHAIIMYEDDSYKPNDRLPDNIVSYELIEEISNQKLKNVADDHASDAVKIVTASSRAFSAAEEILNYADENNIDLIAMGTHGRTELSHLLLGSVAERVIRMAKCPVMTFRSDAKKLGIHQKILVPIDFSDHSRLALRYALELAEIYQSEITLLHVFEQPMHPAFYVAGKTSVFEIDADLKKRATDAMVKFRYEQGKDEIKTNYVFAEGAAYHEIVEHSKKGNFDLLVIATHGLRGLQHFLIGSTTEKVMRHAEIPVLVVKLSERDFIK
jgi:nucleotide-binding universal stress UspA family protein